MDLEQESSSSTLYCMVNNIPPEYHAADLRNFFSQFIETNGFLCFHFRHRPEIRQIKNDDAVASNTSNVKNSNTKTTCCVVSLEETKVNKFIEMYNGMHWLDSKGDTLYLKCFISSVKVSNTQLGDALYKSRKELNQIDPNREIFTQNDLKNLLELKPPHLMPNGNVGTPTKVFLKLIQECKLPAKIIGKLGLVFPKLRGRYIYSSVGYDYGTSIASVASISDVEKEDVYSARGHRLSDIPVKLSQEEATESETESQKSGSDDDDDMCEEWERHEALHNDVTDQERTKERLFEEEIELKWEKGGSGLVFYTDAQHWDEEEGDFDAKTADDWDLDMSVYYEKNAGDKDSKDLVQMRREKRRNTGLYKESVFKSKIGKFEKHTKGIGRKIMEKYNWKEGESLGSSVKGIVEALENDGQNPKDKKGLGYYGEKLSRFPMKRPKKVLISTVYDNLGEVENSERLLRSNVPTTLKHRSVVKSDPS